MVGGSVVTDRDKFVEGQQVWLCVNACGIFQRVKGIISGVHPDRYVVFRFDHRQSIDFPIAGKQGVGEGSAWLENRL